MGVAAIIAAAAATQVVIQQQRRAAEQRRRMQEERHRQEQNRRREEEKRRKERENRRIEEDRRKREEDARRRRLNHKNKSEERLPATDADFAAIEFTDKMILKSESFPAEIAETEFETRYADGTYSTFEEHNGSKVLCLHLENGVTRNYIRKGYYREDTKYLLVGEELPDGRMKTYDTEQNVLFERDAEGNYKTYKPMHKDSSTISYVPIEEGNKDGWSKRYEYSQDYQDGQYVISGTKEILNTEPSDRNGLEFTDKLVIEPDSFPAKVVETEFEIKYADGSYATFEKHDGNRALCLHLENGVTRTYIRKWDYSNNDTKYLLVSEELPDGRMKNYDTEQHVLFERDAEGNYKTYEPIHRGSSDEQYILVEEGNKDGWSKRHEYQSKYQDGQYVITSSKIIFPDDKSVIFDEKHRLVEETDGNTYRRYYPDDKQSLKEEKDSEGNIHKWSEQGKLLEEQLADGTKYCWNELDVMTFERLSTGEETHWTDQGAKIYESLPTGECHKWTAEGVMIYEKLPNGEKREWTDEGSKTKEIFADGSETRWFPNTEKVSYRKESDETFKEFDEKERVIKEGAPERYFTYTYYGDSNNVFDRRSYNAWGQEDKSAYTHYDKNGKEDTEHYCALKEMAKKRMKKEAELSKKEGKRVILPKMSKVKKAFIYQQQLHKFEKEK